MSLIKKNNPAVDSVLRCQLVITLIHSVDAVNSKILKIEGRFYFKRTVNGNLLGEWSNNTITTNYTESAMPSNEEKIPSGFIGEYNSCWFGVDRITPENGLLSIALKLNSTTVYDITWNDAKSKKPIFKGEGFIVDGMLIGNYWSV